MPRIVRLLLVAIPALLVASAIGVWAWKTFTPDSHPGGPPAAEVEEKSRVVGGVTFVVEHRPGIGDFASIGDEVAVTFQRDDDILEFEDGTLILNGIGYPTPTPGTTVRWRLDGPLLINDQPATPHPLQPREIGRPGAALRFGVLMTGHEARDTLSLGWANDSVRLATATKGGIAAVWDVSLRDTMRVIWHQLPGLPTREFPGFLAALSPDGKTLVTGYRGDAIPAVVWDVETKQPRTGPAGQVFGFLFDTEPWLLRTPAGRLAALHFLTDNWLLEVRGERVLARNLTRDPNRTIDLGKVTVPFAPAYAVSGDGATLAVSDGATVTLSRLTATPETLSIAPLASLPVPGVTHLTLSQDGKLLAASNGETRLTLYDVAVGLPGRRLRVREWVGTQGTRMSPGIQALAFAPDGQTLAVGTNNSIRIYDVPSGRERGFVTVSWVRALAYSPNGTYLAAALRGDPEAGTRFWVAAGLR